MRLRFASLFLLGALLPACPGAQPVQPPPPDDPLNAGFAEATDVQVRRMVQAGIGQDASVARWLLEQISNHPPACAEIAISDGIATLTAPAGCATSAGWTLEGSVTYAVPYDLATDNDVRFDRLAVDGPLDDDAVILDGDIRWEYDDDFDRTTYMSLTVTRAGVPVRARMITYTGDDPSALDDGQIASAIGTAAVMDDGGMIVLEGADTLTYERAGAGCGAADVAGEDRELCLFREAPSRFEGNDLRGVSAICDGSTTAITVDTLESQPAAVDLRIGFYSFRLLDATANGDGGYTYTTSDEAQCLSLPGSDYTVLQIGSLGVSTLAEYLVEPPASWGT